MPNIHDSQTSLCRNDDFEDEGDRKKRVKEFTKSSAKYILTQIGLVVLVSGYAVAGGFIFQHLESTNEMSECEQGEKQFNDMQNTTVYKMWTIANSFKSPLDKQYALVEIHKQLAAFRDNMIALGYDGTNCSAKDLPDGPGYKWSFMGSLLFSTTVFTTVGYGNIAPRTFWGRLVCIAYAVLGIPLMLLCLANIGEIMANVFRYVYFNVVCCGCECFRRRVVKSRPKSARQQASSSGENETEAWKNRYNNRGDPNGAVSQTTIVDDDDDDEEEDEGLKISVPLTITIGLLAFYVFMGALLFGVWEGWDWLTAAYFCFITISTIGFGDYVPGYSNNAADSGAQLKMVGAAVYIVFGMALMSMAFNLIQEEMVGKFKWVGQKMGLVKRDDEDEDEEEEEEDVRRHPQPLPVSVPRGPVSAMPHGRSDAKNMMMPGGGQPIKQYYVPHDKSQ